MMIATFLTQTNTASSDIESLNALGEFVSEYGFLTLFGIAAVGLLYIYFRNAGKSETRRKDVELELMMAEKKSTIETNKAMVELVTSVQSKQVVFLEQMSQTINEIKQFTVKTDFVLDDVRKRYTDFSNKLDNLVFSAEKNNDSIKNILENLEATENKKNNK